MHPLFYGYKLVREDLQMAGLQTSPKKRSLVLNQFKLSSVITGFNIIACLLSTEVS